MPDHTDLTFFTNEEGATLLDRFNATLKHTQFFDVLVGYFRTSGFRLMADALESVDHIRILVGLNVDRNTFELLDSQQGQMVMDFDQTRRTSNETREAFREAVSAEITQAPDDHGTEVSVNKFIEFIQAGKLQLKAHPSQKIHAKVYIHRNRGYPDDYPDFGRIITGSSNFSFSGLQGNYEFNVELKQRTDVDYALAKFEELWAEAVDVSEQYVETVRRNTWLNDEIEPWHLYLKLLYEYFQEEINADAIEEDFYLPDGFMNLAYQRQAVRDAQRTLDQYGGVFLADVVGLGKTYISAMLAQQLTGHKLVICPPVLVKYWRDTFRDFGVRSFRVESLGKLEHILRGGYRQYTHVFIDEAHRFRNERTQRYEQLAQICAGKKVILVSATPFNNTIDDIFSQIKLFQPPRNSIIPGVRNLEAFFTERSSLIRKMDREDPDYLPTVKRVAAEVRDHVLNHVMVRRTRTVVTRHYADDIERQGLTFPDIADPQRLIYEFNPTIEAVFESTIRKLEGFRYTRYTPLLYLRRGISGQLEQGQRNVGAFMRMMLVKRLESSFHAFRQTLGRFIHSYERFIRMVEEGTVYIGAANILDLLDMDDTARLMAMVEEGDVEAYDSADFVNTFDDNLISDLLLLREIRDDWERVVDDPKLGTLIEALQRDGVLGKERVIVFTESAETGHYLFEQINAQFPEQVLFYSSGGGHVGSQTMGNSVAREMILSNFDPRAEQQSNQIRVLISTDVLAEGINLQKSPVVINYDLPWNPTRVLQRVGRVNRVGTQHDLVYIFNFFPTDQSDVHLGLEANITAKIQAFHDMLGEDARYLTENEQISDHEFGSQLYQRLNRRETYLGDEENERSELEYLGLIRQIRDEQPELFAQLKRMPKKARAGWQRGAQSTQLTGTQTVTFFRQGRIKKFFAADNSESRELTFFEAVDALACEPDTAKEQIMPDFYEQLAHNKVQFALMLANDEEDAQVGGSTFERRLRRYLNTPLVRRFNGFTENDEAYLDMLRSALDEGRLPQQTLRRAWRAIEKSRSAATNPLAALPILRANIAQALLLPTPTLQTDSLQAEREIILSAYLTH